MSTSFLYFKQKGFFTRHIRSLLKFPNLWQNPFWYELKVRCFVHQWFLPCRIQNIAFVEWYCDIAWKFSYIMVLGVAVHSHVKLKNNAQVLAVVLRSAFIIDSGGQKS